MIATISFQSIRLFCPKRIQCQSETRLSSLSECPGSSDSRVGRGDGRTKNLAFSPAYATLPA